MTAFPLRNQSKVKCTEAKYQRQIPFWPAGASMQATMSSMPESNSPHVARRPPHTQPVDAFGWRVLITNVMFCGFPLGGFLAGWRSPALSWRSVLQLGWASSPWAG